MTDEQSTPINLADDFDDPRVSVTMYGHTFDVPLLDANDELSIIDKKHAADPPIAFPAYTDSEGNEHPASTRANPAFLDSVIELLKRRFGVEKCSREGAWRFYKFVTAKAKPVLAALAEKKSASSETPALPTGLESTADSSASLNDGPGSNACPDSTPSEICASQT